MIEQLHQPPLERTDIVSTSIDRVKAAIQDFQSHSSPSAPTAPPAGFACTFATDMFRFVWLLSSSGYRLSPNAVHSFSLLISSAGPIAVRTSCHIIVKGETEYGDLPLRPAGAPLAMPCCLSRSLTAVALTLHIRFRDFVQANAVTVCAADAVLRRPGRRRRIAEAAANAPSAAMIYLVAAAWRRSDSLQPLRAASTRSCRRTNRLATTAWPCRCNVEATVGPDSTRRAPSLSVVACGSMLAEIHCPFAPSTNRCTAAVNSDDSAPVAPREGRPCLCGRCWSSSSKCQRPRRPRFGADSVHSLRFDSVPVLLAELDAQRNVYIVLAQRLGSIRSNRANRWSDAGCRSNHLHALRKHFKSQTSGNRFALLPFALRTRARLYAGRMVCRMPRALGTHFSWFVSHTLFHTGCCALPDARRARAAQSLQFSTLAVAIRRRPFTNAIVSYWFFRREVR